MADAAHRHQPTVKPLRGDAPVVWDALGPFAHTSSA
jgi:hypothetical protein